MNTFSGYEKMPSNLKKLGLNESEFSKLEKLKWVVTEKAHGANFSFIYENKKLKFAKRKSFLNWDDDFFAFQLVVNKIEGQIVELFEKLSEITKANKYIIYGELLGGKYPHSEVNADTNLQAIQTGVYYSPSVEFYAFDIAIEKTDAKSKYYLDYETSMKLFEESNIIYAKALFIGKFSDALEFNIRINSTIPKQLKLPNLNDNLIEGVVIKPFNHFDKLSTSHISTIDKKLRPIIKLKNPEFEEEKKFHEAKKWNYIPNISSKSEELSFIVEDLRNYITKNRLESAISKIGQLDFNNPKRILEIESEFLRDVLTDFNENNDNFLESLTKEDKLWIENRVKSEISKTM